MKKQNLVNGYGFLMTEKQVEKLSELLTENILERYNTPEYIDYDIIEIFAQDNKLKKINKYKERKQEILRLINQSLEAQFDIYSWAVFKVGQLKPVVCGCSKNEAQYHRRELEKERK